MYRLESRTKKTKSGPAGVWRPVVHKNGQPILCQTKEYAESLIRFCLAGTTHIEARAVKAESSEARKVVSHE